MKLNDTTEIGGRTFRIQEEIDGCQGCYFRGDDGCELPMWNTEVCVYVHKGGWYGGIFVETREEDTCER